MTFNNKSMYYPSCWPLPTSPTPSIPQDTSKAPQSSKLPTSLCTSPPSFSYITTPSTLVSFLLTPTPHPHTPPPFNPQTPAYIVLCSPPCLPHPPISFLPEPQSTMCYAPPIHPHSHPPFPPNPPLTMCYALLHVSHTPSVASAAASTPPPA